MYFSGKISHSVLLYLESKGADFEGLYELTDLNFEFLRDPTSWLDAHLIEDFLFQLHRKYEESFPNFVKEAGVHCPELKAWGVLDGVLKMMKQVSDFYAQPERLISYFISPAPQIHSLEQAPGSVSFDTPISSIEFPMVSEFLKAAFGSLPTYMGDPMANVKWEETQIQIFYGDGQELKSKTDLANNETDHKQNKEVSSELIDSVFHTLEVKQLEIESKNKALNLKEQELQRLKKDLNYLVSNQRKEKNEMEESLNQVQCALPLSQLLLNIQRFNDYFSRAQQLITLLIGSKRLDPQVKAAMKRVKWDQVSELSPFLVQKIYSQVEDLKTCMSDTTNSTSTGNCWNVEVGENLEAYQQAEESPKKLEKNHQSDHFLINNQPL